MGLDLNHGLQMAVTNFIDFLFGDKRNTFQENVISDTMSVLTNSILDKNKMTEILQKILMSITTSILIRYFTEKFIKNKFLNN